MLPTVLVVDDEPKIVRLATDYLEHAGLHRAHGGRWPNRGGARAEPRIPGTVILSVSDTGKGIAPEDLPHVFDRFYKSGPSPGSGLGLAIARNLITLHGGRITAESPHGGETTVRIILPVDQTDNSEPGRSRLRMSWRKTDLPWRVGAMRVRTLSAIAILLLLFLAVPRVALAQSELRVTGVVTSLFSTQGTFTLQELTGNYAAGRIWTIRVTSGTEWRQTDGYIARGTDPTLRLLQVGDVVEIQGWFVGGSELVARTIVVRPELAGGGPSTGVRGQPISVTGTIVDLQFLGQGVLRLQAMSAVQGPRTLDRGLWTVRLVPQTRVGSRRPLRESDEERFGLQAALQMLRVGDLVEVEGRLIGNRLILANAISLRSRGGAFQRPPLPYPAYPGQFPFQGQIVILSPQQGAEVPAGEFAVIGRAMPGAEVRVEVSGRFGLFTVGVASGTVTADQTGLFVFPVRPRLRVPGTIYTISVSSTFQGYSWAPVSITVRQQ